MAKAAKRVDLLEADRDGKKKSGGGRRRKSSGRRSRRDGLSHGEVAALVGAMLGDVFEQFGHDVAAWPADVVADARLAMLVLGSPEKMVFERSACACGCTPALRVDLVKLLAGVRFDA